MAVNHKGFIIGKNERRENTPSSGYISVSGKGLIIYVFKFYPSMPWLKPYEDVLKVIQGEYDFLVMVFRAD